MEKIIDKVKKLIALGTNVGAAEGERENAMRMAHALLAKHNLSMADLEGSDSQEEREELFSDYYVMPWYGITANAIAKLFFCYCYTSKNVAWDKNADKRIRVYFIGKTSNVVTAKLMSDYLIKSIEKEQRTGKYKMAFCNGAAARICQRVKEMTIIASQDNSSCTDIAIVNIYKSEQQANKAFVESKGLSFTKKKTRQTLNDAAEYRAGVEFGSKVSLNNQVSGSKSNQAKLH